MRRIVLTALTGALCALAAQGCVTPEPAGIDPGQTFEALYKRDLSSFERQLAMEQTHGHADTWTSVGVAWLDLVNCTGIRREDERTEALEQAGDDLLAQLMYATVVLEIRRRNARIFGAEADGAPKLWHDISTPDFFDRAPKALPDHLIRWPGEDESWIDEGMATVELESQCASLRKALLDARTAENKENKDKKDEPIDPLDERRHWQSAQLDAIERMVAIEKNLDEAHTSANIALLMWRARVHGAHLALILGKPERGYALLEPIDSETPATKLERGEAANMLFLRARLAVDSSKGVSGKQPDKQPDKQNAALADLERALAAGLPSPNADRARYLALKILTDLGRFDEALTKGAPLPKRGSPLFEPFAYRLALAARQTGDDERFFGIATKALHDASGPASPFQRAIYAQALNLLATYEFDRRVVELVENLGPKNQLFERLFELAQAAVKRGYPQNAAALGNWLLRHHHNHRFKARYHRLLAVAAFLQDDERGFREQVHAMTRRPAQVIAALGEARQAQFFADADRAFARLMGQMLPAMADWGEDPGAKSRRQKWLAITVEETQAFLRSVERSEVQHELLELYKLASNLLEEHPRGYAERLGTKEPAPLVLGTVQVGHGELVDSEPRVEPALAAPYFLSLVPRAQRPVSEWTFGWPDAEEGKQEGEPQKSQKHAEVADE